MGYKLMTNTIISETAKNNIKQVAQYVAKGNQVEIVFQFGTFKSLGESRALFHHLNRSEPINNKVAVYSLINGKRKHLFTVESPTRLCGLVHLLYHLDESTITKYDYVLYFNDGYRHLSDSKLTQLYLKGALQPYPFIYIHDGLETYLDINLAVPHDINSITQVFRMIGYNLQLVGTTPVLDKYVLTKFN